MKSKVLITGINSFLALSIYEQVKESYEVYGLYHSNKINIPEGIKLVKLDDLSLLGDCFDIVFHIAAYVPEKDAVNEKMLFDVNVKLTLDLLQLFKSARFIFASSVSVYGESKGVLTEKSSTLNAGTYGLSKLWAEQLVRTHPSYAIFRISSMYGKGMKKVTFLPLVIDYASKNNLITLFGDGKREQNYIHVSDVAGMMIAGANINSNGTYLAVSAKSNSNLEIASLIGSFIGQMDLIHKGEDNGQSFHYDASNSYKMLNFIPKVGISDGIKELIEWIKK